MSRDLSPKDFSINETLICVLVYDANGQLPVGVLSGNVNIYGDFQECLSIDDLSELRGKHCFTQLQPFVTEPAIYLNYLRKLAQSFDLMQSNFRDVSTTSIIVCSECKDSSNYFHSRFMSLGSSNP